MQELRSAIVLNIIKGLNFCQVAKIRHMGQLMLAITLGSHWWQGAIPSLINILTKNNVLIIKLSLKLSVVKDIMPAVSINPLPTAWTIKYFTLASVSCMV